MLDLNRIVAELHPHDALLVAAHLRRYPEARAPFADAPGLLDELLAQLEERGSSPTSDGGNVVDIAIERSRRRPAPVTISGQASPLRPVRSSQRELAFASLIAPRGRESY